MYPLDRTGELCANTVTCRAEESATMLRDERIDYLTAGVERTDGRFFISPHQAAIAVDVGAEYGGKFTFHTRIWERHHVPRCSDCQITPAVCRWGPVLCSLRKHCPRGGTGGTRTWPNRFHITSR